MSCCSARSALQQRLKEIAWSIVIELVNVEINSSENDFMNHRQDKPQNLSRETTRNLAA
jgi:hypothetical protein